ncbi:hypothetical protein [Cytobacillus sp. SAFR-174]|uniref:hypothetical protein n=1 Tax=Cytobacillus sp. SAFR-174 TaxID=3436868 RepID=UPI003F7E474A
MSVNITNRNGKIANKEGNFANRLLEPANRMANLQIEREILQIEQSSTHMLPALIEKEDRLIPVTEFGRCDV